MTAKNGGVAEVHVNAGVPVSAIHGHVGVGVLSNLEFMGTVGIVFLWHDLHGRLLLLLLLLGALHLVQEVREVAGSKKHASQVVQAGVLRVESAVLEAHLAGLVGSGGDLTLELADIFW